MSPVIKGGGDSATRVVVRLNFLNCLDLGLKVSNVVTVVMMGAGGGRGGGGKDIAKC